MSENSVLWNTVDTLVSGLAKEVEESLETNTEPDWTRVRRDLDIALNLVRVLA